MFWKNWLLKLVLSILLSLLTPFYFLVCFEGCEGFFGLANPTSLLFSSTAWFFFAKVILSFLALLYFDFSKKNILKIFIAVVILYAAFYLGGYYFYRNFTSTVMAENFYDKIVSGMEEKDVDNLYKNYLRNFERFEGSLGTFVGMHCNTYIFRNRMAWNLSETIETCFDSNTQKIHLVRWSESGPIRSSKILDLQN
jgi:type I restriction-modification system DNA methylase subunit